MGRCSGGTHLVDTVGLDGRVPVDAAHNLDAPNTDMSGQLESQKGFLFFPPKFVYK
jgi:hypothetical protein